MAAEPCPHPGAMPVKQPFLLSSLLLLAAGAQPALAQQKFENLDRIDGLVAMTVGANIGEPGGPVAPPCTWRAGLSV